MDRHNLHCFFVVYALLSSFLSAGLSLAADRGCVEVRRAMEQKKHLLSEYTSALQISYDRKELQVAELLNFKINELKAQIEELERTLARCPHGNTDNPVEGLATAKSDEGRYSDKNCQELRKILFSLVRTIHGLNKRKKSLLLNFSEKEERQLREATEEQGAVEHILSTKCSEKQGQGGLLKRLRR